MTSITFAAFGSAVNRDGLSVSREIARTVSDDIRRMLG